MAITTFIPTLWEARLLANFHNTSVADLITTAPTEILPGNKVRFNRVSSVAVKDYEGSVSYDGLTTPNVDLNLDQKKYFAFKVNDVDKIQAAGDVLDATTVEAAATLQEVVDKFVLSQYTGADADNLIGTDEAPISLTKTNAYDSIVDLGTKLSKKRVPRQGRYVVVNSEVLGLLSKDDRFTRIPEILASGVVNNATINGMTIVVSEDVTNAAGKYKFLALHQSAIGYGKQLDEVEALRLQDDFADSVRGLCVHGATVLRPEALAVLTATIA
ncbi:phage major capsid protein [Sporolactobacillus terrae]|uniref:phage major capsid protein n=1 Tax=Sporolactobacillus terrae TaxID=269673 RepID=UPI001119FA72|nr:hypothetical protein [Sporolactobacillus terrae]